MKKIVGMKEVLTGIAGRPATFDGEELTIGRVLSHFLASAHNKSAKQDLKCRRLAERFISLEDDTVLLENGELEILKEAVEQNGPGITAFIRGKASEVVESAEEVKVEEKKG